MTSPSNSEPTINKLVVMQNAYSPYVAVLDANAGPDAASELVDRIRIQGQGGEGGAAQSAPLNIILVLDVSVSMREPADQTEGSGYSTKGYRRSIGATRLDNAIKGAIAGVQSVPPTARVGVVAFSESAQEVGSLQPATDGYKRSLATGVKSLEVVGGTRMSTGLDMARQMFVNAGCAGQTNIVILLTDGDNNNEDESNLRRVSPLCAATFQTEALGFGIDWNEDMLTKIVRNLQGPNVPQLVRGTDDAGKFFTDLVKSAAKKSITDLRLRIETRMTAELLEVQQMVPHQEDLTPRGKKVLVDADDDIWAVEFGFGAFGANETRDVLVRWKVKNLPPGQARVIADISVIYAYGGGAYRAEALPLPGQPQAAGVRLQPNQVAAIWTNEAQRWSTVVPEVDFYTKQTAITAPLREGAAAAGRGDVRKATELLQTAYDAAKAAGATAQLSQIETLVTPRADGTVQLREDVDEATIKSARLKATTSTMMTTED